MDLESPDVGQLLPGLVRWEPILSHELFYLLCYASDICLAAELDVLAEDGDHAGAEVWVYFGTSLLNEVCSVIG